MYYSSSPTNYVEEEEAAVADYHRRMQAQAEADAHFAEEEEAYPAHLAYLLEALQAPDEEFEFLADSGDGDVDACCSICLCRCGLPPEQEQKQDEEVCVLFPCPSRHRFHRTCIRTWVTRHADSCPLCRVRVRGGLAPPP